MGAFGNRNVAASVSADDWKNGVRVPFRSYDAAGNALTLPYGATAEAFTYDDLGRMSQSKMNGVVYRNYSYNARGERVAKINPTGATTNFNFVYEAGPLLGEYNSAGGKLREYVWLDDTLVGVIANSDGSTAGYELVATDQLGTPRV